jgi:hypothetical protein
MCRNYLYINHIYLKIRHVWYVNTSRTNTFRYKHIFISVVTHKYILIWNIYQYRWDENSCLNPDAVISSTTWTGMELEIEVGTRHVAFGWGNLICKVVLVLRLPVSAPLWLCTTWLRCHMCIGEVNLFWFKKDKIIKRYPSDICLFCSQQNIGSANG